MREDMPLLFEKMRASGNRRVDLGAEFQSAATNQNDQQLLDFATEWVVSAISRLEEYRHNGYPPNNAVDWDHFQELIDLARDEFLYGDPNLADRYVEKCVELFRACGYVLSRLGFSYGNGVYVMLMDVAKRFVPMVDSEEDRMYEFLEGMWQMTQDKDTIEELINCLSPQGESNLIHYTKGIWQQNGDYLAGVILF